MFPGICRLPSKWSDPIEQVERACGAGRAELSRVKHRNRPSRLFGRDKFSGARQSFEASRDRTSKDRGRQSFEKSHHLFLSVAAPLVVGEDGE